jgi:hypothetical protein
MTEAGLILQISRIVNGHVPFKKAVDQIASLLEAEANGRALILDLKEDRPAPVPDFAKFLDAFELPYRSLFSVDLKDGSKRWGRVVLCFASSDFQGEQPRRISHFVGEQLGMLLGRTRLRERNAKLNREIEKIADDLAHRKLMQRAEGLLIANRRMTAEAARRWIEQQSVKTGLSIRDVADRVIAYHQANGFEQKIA